MFSIEKEMRFEKVCNTKGSQGTQRGLIRIGDGRLRHLRRIRFIFGIRNDFIDRIIGGIGGIRGMADVADVAARDEGLEVRTLTKTTIIRKTSPFLME